MRIPVLLLCSAIATCPGCDRGAWDKEEHYIRSQVIEVPGTPTSVAVRSGNASVELLVDRGVLETTIHADFEIDSDSVAEANNRLRASSLEPNVETGRLLIEPHLLEDVSVHLVITMPDVEGVFIETGNGSVKLAGASGEAYVKTDNGSVKVLDQEGTVTARSGNGSITVTNPTDALDLHTENGDITIENASSDVRARTANGSISVGVLAVMTPSLQLFSSNGSITGTVGPAFTGEVDLVADIGTIRLSDVAEKVTAQVVDDDGNRHLVIGGGVNKSTLRTSNGSVTFIINPPANEVGTEP